MSQGPELTDNKWTQKGWPLPTPGKLALLCPLTPTATGVNGRADKAKQGSGLLIVGSRLQRV